MMKHAWPGRPWPLGSSWDGQGVNFALWSKAATKVELCLFDRPDAPVEHTRVVLAENTAGVWHAYLPDVGPGQLYAYRVHGPWDPQAGLCSNPNKLLLDPWAKAITSPIHPHPSMYDIGKAPSTVDSAPHLPRCVVINDSFDWGDQEQPRVPWHDTVIYECHVRGMTIKHPLVPEADRGTYLGLAAEPIIEHLKALGVTALQLMPVQHFAHEKHLGPLGLNNYWGYNPVATMAPYSAYASGGLGQQVDEFKTMVKSLHNAGIEVLLDVVFNHTAEGDHLGPTYNLKGIDNQAYYRLQSGDQRRYQDYSGCGNTLDIRHSRVVHLVMDAMRYWVSEMHVDGFRFDLASTLGRDPGESFDPTATFFQVVSQDPLLRGVKLIAESWDVGADGYQLGAYPAGWAEWNDRYRDTVRTFWRGDKNNGAQLATRLAGSSDIFGYGVRGPMSSINYVTCHDGFTLIDLVRYKNKHNEANGEHNKDGSEHNLSSNWGVEGPSSSASIIKTRDQIRCAMMATLAFSQGVPMISHGDELSHTRKGNNNPYCQDNEINWLNWNIDARDSAFLDFVRTLFALRAEHSVLRRRAFFHGRLLVGEAKDLTWLLPDGGEINDKNWSTDNLCCFGMLIHGHAADYVDERGLSIHGRTLLVLINSCIQARSFVLPGVNGGGLWHVLLDTSSAEPAGEKRDQIELAGQSLMLMEFEAL